ncbi:MAG: ATPase AAA, ATP-dependent Clp protease ATP-binding subunit ClpC [Candidatus Peregrinibacteria bacterium GW2011_GWF2_43_17]|nr:MAG: ATPase AAA, ATP-dependent Clp protease ATP-binding subunit ClpC [Candidatus Peregrinibacteria bacterium GW2011_GWF2_43_17]KKT20072.1 MAG: ATPase AAA-2 domain protein [Candidatus Peregrinibacteria bacterium GW2011_GWA2_43_8]HAU39735.1 ATP-dependent Clp protease ATP-binding subunit ClpC [Candidatus Peregrinibacteria bacterium]
MQEPNKFDKFTKEARQALVVAQEVAKQMKSDYTGTEHILLGILSQTNSLGAAVLMNFGVSLENVNLVLKSVGRAKTASGTKKPIGMDDGMSLSGFAKKVIEESLKYAHGFGHMFVGTEHLLYALVNQENTAATVILENMKINPEDIKNELHTAFETIKGGSGAFGMMGGNGQHGVNPLELLLGGLQNVMVGNQKEAPYKKKKNNSKTPALDYFTIDLVDQYRKKELDPIIGREKEIERTISILQRKTKNNPVIIGEPGVGKTAVVEGLAQAILQEKVPTNMLGKRILQLQMSSVVAGTKYRGEFEERFKQIIDEAMSADDVILFIDELHTVIGAGAAEGSLDAANILKPALSRGKLQVIGATTINEYRKNVEKDAALERRFQPIVVDEPAEDDCIAILKGIRSSFEEHHNLVITDEAIASAVVFSKRYVNDRFLPDKAIDLIDEAAALKSMQSNTDSSELKKLQKKLGDIIKQKEECVSRQDYEKAAELRTQEIDTIKGMEKVRQVKVPKELRGNISEDDIAQVVAKMTGIPVAKLVKTDTDRLMNLETYLHKRIVGQESAVKAVSTAIRRSRTGISNPNRPIGSFMFLGPTGVGKTELVKALASEIYNDENALIKIDMSEFMERHNTSRLVGATAGYVGYEEGGQLTEAVRRKPYSVVLFDEVEKAHPEVFNLLLQILEDGVLTDSKGRKVDFKNTIIVMTSNIGAEQLTEKAGPIGFHLDANELSRAAEAFKEKKDQVLEELKKHFRPEFLNRVDKVIVFDPLTHDNIKNIVTMQIDILQKRISDKKITIQLTPTGLDMLAELSYDPAYGARPVRRQIQDRVEDPLAQGMLEGKFKEGSMVKVSKKGSDVEISLAKKVKATA